MSIDCKFIEEKLIEYVYDEITDNYTIEEIKQHLKICFKCREKYEAYIKIKENIKKIDINFPEEVWDLHRQEIKKKLYERKTAIAVIKETIFNLFNIKKIVFAFLIILFAFVGIQFVKTNQENEKYKKIIENIDILENISVIEQLDFYTKIKEGDFNL